MKNSFSNRSAGGKPNRIKHAGLPLLILLFCFSGCSFGILEGFRKTEPVDVTPVSWFKTEEEHMLMNTAIDVMKNHFSGIMVIKPLADSGYRVVFLTEVGLKIFDMEFVSGKQVRVYYIMEALDRKIVVNTLSADIKLFLMQLDDNRKPVIYESTPGSRMIKYKQKRIKVYYEISSLTGRPVRAWQASGTSKKTRVDYYSRDGLQIDSIHLARYHLNLRIGLRRINEINRHAAE